MDDWTVFRLTDEPLRTLGGGTRPAMSADAAP